jgi:acetoin utilization protein AcuB
VSDKDLLHAAPSPATSLSVHELHYLLAKLTIKQVMSSPVITVTPDTPIEEAARIMADGKIGGLPVVDGNALVGIITETDIFKILVELLGARSPGLRLTVAAHDSKGGLARLTGAITNLGGNIVSVVVYGCTTDGECRITLRIADVEEDSLHAALSGIGVKVVDLRSI